MRETQMRVCGKKKCQKSVIVLDLKISELFASTILYNCKHHMFGFLAVWQTRAILIWTFPPDK